MWKIVKGLALLLVAAQLAVVPPLLPAQVQLHGPAPLTAEAVPIAQRLVAGTTPKACALALPQAPLTAPLLPPPVKAAVLTGFGVPAAKSLALLSVSVAPPPARMAAVVLVRAGAAAPS